MWLLSTDRAELHYFAKNLDAMGYAVLSHTWDEGGEQSLQEVRAIGVRCRASGTNPRDDLELSSKIRECCILAEKHGFRWVWIDSCCIDKTSSSELSEAINSMYDWYESSEVCYAYLKDVPSDSILQSPNSAFWNSRWHTRGWTLQELVAPDSVIFLSTDWRELGTRAELAMLLEMITQLPTMLMLGVTRPAEYSACTRMSWASKRQTTRSEDEAYCLMGLFGVKMPTNYGEGKRAFVRLQYEIMQHKQCDPSLFAFGEPIMPKEILRDGIVFEGNNSHIDRDNSWQYLLADSPRQFRSSFGYIPDLGKNAPQQYPPPEDSKIAGPFDRVELPHATATSYGIKFRLPIAIVDDVTLAVILCVANNRNFGLFLTKDDRSKDPQKPRYFVGRGYTRPANGYAIYLARMCDLGDDLYKLSFNGKRVTATWRTIYLVRTPSDLNGNATSPRLFTNCNLGSRIQLPRWLVDRFIALQFEVGQAAYSETLQVIRIVHRSDSGRIYVCFGTCTEHHDGPDDSKPSLWAKVFVTTVAMQNEYSHDCSQDHLDSESWTTHSRTFGNADRMVRLSLAQSRRMLPETFIVIHLELSGNIFEESVLKGAGISFPPLANPEGDSSWPIPHTLATSLEPRRPWLQVGAFDDDAQRLPHIAKFSLKLQSEEVVRGRSPATDPTPNPSVTPPQSRPPSPQPELSSPANSSSSQQAVVARHRTPFTQILRLFSKRRLHTIPMPRSTSVQPTKTP